MEKRKKKTGKIVLFVLLFLMIAAIAAAGWYFLQRQENSSGSGASILSTHVKTGSVQKTLSGTGTLAEQEMKEVAVQTGVRITEFFVRNGQIVKAGDPVAAVNRASVMEAISSLREVMKEVSADIYEIQSTSLTTTITAAATGRVKAIYASEGEQVQDVLLRDGALAILSLDGLMAVKVPMEAAVGIGQTVVVILSDGTELPGRVETAQEGIATITIDDKYGKIGETVQLKTADGRLIGSGQLYVHSAWKAFASEGLVYGVYLYEGQVAEAGVVLFRVDLPVVRGGYEALAAEHREYEGVLAELFRMYDSGVVTAPCDGCVSGVDDSILQQLSSSGNGYRLELLSFEGGELEYGNRVGMVTGVNSDGSISALMQSWDADVASYLQTGTLDTSVSSMTQPYSATYPYAFSWDGSQWQRKNIEVGDVYLFAYNSTDLAMMVYVGHNNYIPSSASSSSAKDDASESDESKDKTGKTKDDSEKKEGEESQAGKGGSGNGGNKSGGSSVSGAGGGSMSGSGNEAEAQVAKRYDTTGTTILGITPQETVTVTITVDELDILSVREGQEASVTLDALPGRSFTGMITEVDTTAANEGGNTKYSATIELEKEGIMLGGMNASVNITIDSRENVLLIPSEALTEKNGKSAVYTAYNERTGELSGLKEVETGLSDGLQVEIISGLEEGETVWYSYYDKLEIEGLTA